jgi:hypothetical protein
MLTSGIKAHGFQMLFQIGFHDADDLEEGEVMVVLKEAGFCRAMNLLRYTPLLKLKHINGSDLFIPLHN